MKKWKKAAKGSSAAKKINVTLPRSSILTICKSFTRPHLDYDQPNYTELSEKNESVQYNAPLTVTDATRETSKEKLYQDLGLESLKNRRLLTRLCYLHKVLSTKLTTYLYELILPILNFRRNPGCYRALYCRTDLFQNSFLPFSINEWNKLDPDIKLLILTRYSAKSC